MGGIGMTPNHAADCAFAVSFGDEPCDCDGPSEVSTPVEPGTLSPLARYHLTEARESLKRRPA